MELTLELIKTCKLTALSCRKCVSFLSSEEPLHKAYLRSFKQCEDLCFAFLQAAADNSVYLEKIAFLCIGLCEECADIGNEKNNIIFTSTAENCRRLSNLLFDFIPAENKRMVM